MGRIIKNSFRGGIIDGSLSARVDLEKYNQGCKVLKNFILQPQGGVYRRPALKFISEPSKDGTITSDAVQPTLVPLVYNSETSYLLALLELTCKIYRDDSFLDQVSTPLTEEQNKTADYAQSADTIYLVHKDSAPFKIIRTSTSSFINTLLAFAFGLASPGGFGVVWNGATGTTSIEYAITALTDDGQESLPVFVTETTGKSPLEWLSTNYATLTWNNPGSSLPAFTINASAVPTGSLYIVAVGTASTGYTSIGGVTWTPTNNLNLGTPAYSLALDPSLPRYVAGGGNGSISYSNDGVTWTGPVSVLAADKSVIAIVNSPISNWWVLAGSGNLFPPFFARSSDGITWSTIALTLSPTGGIVVTSSGRFIVFGTVNRYSVSDNDGLTWSGAVQFPGSPYGGGGAVSVCEGPSLLVAVGANVAVVSSDNGGSWSVVSSPALSGTTMKSVIYSTSVSLYIAGGNGGRIAYSQDGITWEKVDNSTFGTKNINTVFDVTPLGYVFALGEDGQIAASFDGKIWITITVPDSYNLYKKKQGIYGYIGNVRGDYTFDDYNYDPIITDSIPEAYNPFVAENPSVVALFQQRLWFANTVSKSQTIFASRIGDFENFNYSPFIRPDDSIENTIFSNRPDGIQWMIPFNDNMKVGTVEKIWTLASSSGGAITPSDIKIDPDVSWGSSKIKPVLAGNSIIYIENKGSKVFDIFERQEYLGFTGNNLSVNSSELFEGFEIMSTAYQRTPDPIVWCVRSDGKVVAMTYFKNEDLWAWHFHETDGLFKSVAVIPGETYDEVYFVVAREIQSVTHYYIEKLDDKWMGDTIEDAKFLDSMITQESGTPFTVVTGLDHLEGETVRVIADGEVVSSSFVVSSGQITLSSPANKVHVGLSYGSIVSPLSNEFATQSQGISLGRTKSIGEVTLRLKNSKGGKIGARLDYLDPIRSYDYDASDNYTGDVRVQFVNKADSTADIFITQDEPLPMTISALFIEIIMGER